MELEELKKSWNALDAVSYTHLRAVVCYLQILHVWYALWE